MRPRYCLCFISFLIQSVDQRIFQIIIERGEQLLFLIPDACSVVYKDRKEPCQDSHGAVQHYVIRIGTIPVCAKRCRTSCEETKKRHLIGKCVPPVKRHAHKSEIIHLPL